MTKNSRYDSQLVIGIRSLVILFVVSVVSSRSNIAKQHQIRKQLSRGRNCRLRAFTIIELVIVVLITGLLAAVAAPAFFDSMLFHQVETAARRVKADLELARSTARLTSSSQSATFTNSGYTLSNAIKNLDNVNDAYAVDLTDTPYALDQITPNFGGSATVSFNGYGTPSSGGTVVLNLKSHYCTVTLNSATGEVTITSLHTGGRTAQVSNN